MNLWVGRPGFGCAVGGCAERYDINQLVIFLAKPGKWQRRVIYSPDCSGNPLRFSAKIGTESRGAGCEKLQAMCFKKKSCKKIAGF